MVSKEMQQAFKMMREAKAASAARPMTPEVALEDRRSIDEVLSAAPQSPRVETQDVLTEECRGEFYTYDSDDQEKLKGKVLLFIHGGGFMNGTVASRRRLCHSLLERAKMDAFSVEYGQWPEAEHPQGLNDVIAGYRWLLAKGYDHDDIFIFGESAGAMLTLTMILTMKSKGMPLPKKACVFSPVAGQKLDYPSHDEREERDPMLSYEPVVPYYAHADFSSYSVSPVYGDFHGFPELAIHVGSEEVLFDDAVAIYERCIAADVNVTLRVWEELFHVFVLFESPESDQAFEEIGLFFRNSVL